MTHKQVEGLHVARRAEYAEIIDICEYYAKHLYSADPDFYKDVGNAAKAIRDLQDENERLKAVLRDAPDAPNKLIDWRFTTYCQWHDRVQKLLK